MGNKFYFYRLTRQTFDKIRGLRPGTVITVHPAVKTDPNQDEYHSKLRRECELRGLIVEYKEES